ncbi:bifunctional RNase H/acid phosphatase [Rugosimonospora africana]|uniref:Bifunctional RNase H/acid phosphatase n=1 Tax=Rugosimonospora africana TaxID=556532 RepID=A0A8J3VSA6_9ACTN|nr:bifunctional RNase H/acid phosphatase [Rugosimonospora africana]GIH17050.1 bifunctional RNase H/acid phosphatase [Rugosimonospora africana]
MSVERVVVEADGGSRGNPGPAGYGAVVRDAESGEVLVERYQSLGVTTNNVAEYSGLIAGLSAAAELGASEVDVRMDSKLVIEQMSGRWQIKHAGLRPLAAEAATLVRRFGTVRFGWIPRERNKHADALANRAMDEATGKPPPPTAKSATARASVDEAAGEPRTIAGPDSPGRAAARSVAAAAASTGTAPVAGAPGPGAPGTVAGPGAPGEVAERETASGTGKPSWERPVGVPTRLILVRHGETEMNSQRRYSGRGDVPLSERGLAQARATAARLAPLAGTVPAVVSSPLSRATGTATLLAEALGGPPVNTDPDLIESDFGDWEGLTFTEVREGWPAHLTKWLDSPAVAPPNGESFQAVDRRVRRSVGRLREAYPGRTVVVVSHVSPIKLLLRDALAAGDAFLYRLHLDPAGVSIVDSWPDGGVAVRTVNDTAHLAGLE